MINVKNVIFQNKPSPTVCVLFDNDRYQLMQLDKPVASPTDIADMLAELADNIRSDENLVDS